MLKVRIQLYGAGRNQMSGPCYVRGESFAIITAFTLSILVHNGTFQTNLFNKFSSKPDFVLADAYYIPLVCYLSRKSV